MFSKFVHIMSMKGEIIVKELLAAYYAINHPQEKNAEGRTRFKYKEHLYFTIIVTNNKAIHMEQTTLAYFLAENGFQQAATLVPNIYGEWITTYQGQEYMVVKVADLQESIQGEHGALLARFHQLNSHYHYEPKNVSSYGQWKKLWIDKCTGFEQSISEASKKHTNDYYRLLVDVLPYIIGISENAIQYIQESEHENRHGYVDQGTISFQRYDHHLLSPVIWQTDLVFDHPARDLAEFIRTRFLQADKQAQTDVWNFLEAYQTVQKLTPFSWRLLYARLIYPISLYDCMEMTFHQKDFKEAFERLEKLLKMQQVYEQHLREFYLQMTSRDTNLGIPKIQWL